MCTNYENILSNNNDSEYHLDVSIARGHLDSKRVHLYVRPLTRVTKERGDRELVTRDTYLGYEIRFIFGDTCIKYNTYPHVLPWMQTLLYVFHCKHNYSVLKQAIISNGSHTV
jgi:hypothetical protein